MKWIIDRIEGSFALCEMEDKSIINIPLKALPDGIKEGNVISVFADKAETDNRKEKIDKLMNSLFKD